MAHDDAEGSFGEGQVNPPTVIEWGREYPLAQPGVLEALQEDGGRAYWPAERPQYITLKYRTPRDERVIVSIGGILLNRLEPIEQDDSSSEIPVAGYVSPAGTRYTQYPLQIGVGATLRAANGFAAVLVHNQGHSSEFLLDSDGNVGAQEIERDLKDLTIAAYRVGEYSVAFYDRPPGIPEED